jgi:secreted PhoX family phosphatase
MGAGALWMFSLPELMSRRAYGEPLAPSPYGPLSPKIDGTTGLPLLELPDGFSYWSYSWTGDPLAGGTLCPNLHDGMAVVQGDPFTRRLTLVRNHEGGNGTPYTNRKSLIYDGNGAGGTTNLIFNALEGKWESAWASLAGTVRNCAGGVTPWNSWITCEETGNAGHGWNFDVGATAGDPTPLLDMGRFSHEALMVDPLTGYVYETEDSGNAGFYKFVPHEYGKLKVGGDLYMLKVKNQMNTNLSAAYALGTTWDVEWVKIDDPTAAAQSTYTQGANKGGARFARLEGAWWGDQTGYFLSTSGGVVGEGQVFEYNPAAETLKLIYDSPAAQELDNPDNMTVTPRGGLLLCEDGGEAVAPERLIGLTLDGKAFTFALNNINFLAPGFGNPPNPHIEVRDYRSQEWAGACYSPDGHWLFVNIQTPGVTFAITGPWGSGPL